LERGAGLWVPGFRRGIFYRKERKERREKAGIMRKPGGQEPAGKNQSLWAKAEAGNGTKRRGNLTTGLGRRAKGKGKIIKAKG
jgi:hypothetical protein